MSGSMSRAVAAIRRLVAHPEHSDRVLLQRFARQRDEDAFAELVARHGPLVCGVCRRLLHDAALAEDVFQATFLVLAQKAATGNWRAGIGPWLHAVAVRLCRKALSRLPTTPVDPDTLSAVTAHNESPASQLDREDTLRLLDEELARLPETLRHPLVLCYLQGLTRDEAARQLGISLATLKRRLERGRRLLHARLSRRGITLASAGLGVLISTAPLTAGEAGRTARAAVAFLQRGSAPAPIIELVRETVPASLAARFILPALLALCLGAGILGTVLLSKDRPIHAQRKNAGQAPEPAVSQPFPADPLPAGAVARFGSSRLQDFTIDRSATFSPDGKLLATSGANSPICVWDVATGKRVRTHSTRGSVFDLRWKPDGKLAALTFFGHNSFLMQEFGNGPPDMDLDARITEEARNRERRGGPATNDRLHHVFLSADGRKVVAIWTDVQKPIRRISLYPFTGGVSSARARVERTIEVPAGYGTWLSADGRFLLVHVEQTGKPGRIMAFDLTAPKDRQAPAWQFTPPGNENRRPDSCFSANGKRVVILFWDDTVELWDGPSGKRLRELPKLPRYYHHGNGEWRGIDLTPDGKRLALIYRNPKGAMGGQVIDVDTGKDICTLVAQPMPRIGGGARLSADGKYLAQVGYGIVRLWNARTGADACPLPGHRGGVKSLVIAPDGKTVISAGEDLTVRAWGPATGKESWRTIFAQSIKVKFATPDALVVQEDRWGDDGPTTLLDPATGKPRQLPGKLSEAKEDVLLAIAPDGKTMVSLDRKAPALRVWSWPDGAALRTIRMVLPGKFRVSRCAAVSFTPDGKQLVTVMHYAAPDPLKIQFQQVPDDRFIERWDLTTGKLLEQTHTKDFSNPLLLPAGNRLLLLEKSQVRDAVSGREIVQLSFADGQTRDLTWASGAALSPDGRTLAVTEGSGTSILLFEMRTGRHRATLSAEGRYQHALRFLPDGRLVSAGDTALVWAVGLPHRATGKEPLSEGDLARLWANLSEVAPEKAWPAMTRLAQDRTTVAFIRKQVQPVPKVTEADLDRLFRQLDADRFKDREKASRELARLGAGAVARVKARLKKGVSEEVKKRVKPFLDRYDRPGLSPDELRSLRAVEVLEAIGTPEAREALGEWARGSKTARLTRDAADALARLQGGQR
jgi:RNA polymerase sigma factor (sigma-70 family)